MPPTITQLLSRLERQQHALGVTMRLIARREAARVPEAHAGVRLVQEIVATHYGFTVDQLIGYRRTDDVVLARHMAIAIAAELCPQRISPLARAFCRTHDLVPFARAAIAARRAQSAPVDADFLLLRSRCATALAPTLAA